MPLIDPEKQWVAERAAAIPSSTFPIDVATRLPPLVEEFRGDHPHSPALDLEIQAATVAAVYGPLAAGLMPDEVIDELMGEGVYTPEQLCDWAIARGCLRPYGEPRDWAHCWLPAWDTLFTMIRSLIQDAVAWFGNRIGELGCGRRHWVFQEASACAALIRGNLVRGCTCHERDFDFHVHGGIHRCATDHALETFEPREKSLRDFLWRAAILGELRLADDVHAEKVMTNAARKGILSRIISVKGSQLAAGYVLKCKKRECRADIDLNDKCTNGHAIIAIKETIWWFWIKGERGPCYCRRCKGCNGLYFQHSGECPFCGENNWSRDPTFVWVRRFQRPVDSNDPALDWNWFRQLGKDALDELLATLPIDARAVADVFFDDQVPPGQIRDNLDPRPTDEEWRRIWQQIAYVFRGIGFYGVATWRARRETIAELTSPDREVGDLVFLRGFGDAEVLEILNFLDKTEFRRCKRRVKKILNDRGLLDE